MKENMMDWCDRPLHSFCTHRPDRDNNNEDQNKHNNNEDQNKHNNKEDQNKHNNNEDQNKQMLFLKRC